MRLPDDVDVDIARQFAFARQHGVIKERP